MTYSLAPHKKGARLFYVFLSDKCQNSNLLAF